VGSFADSPDGELRVWPLQLIFHNVGWYLLFEEDQVGREQGLIRSERLDRLALRNAHDGDLRRSAEHHRSPWLGWSGCCTTAAASTSAADLEQQLALASPSAQRRSQALTTLRFCCAPWAFAFIREGLQRYPIEHTRFSRPCRQTAGGTTPRRRMCSSPARPIPATPTRWSSICRPGPWRPTSTCAAGCSPLAAASASSARMHSGRSCCSAAKEAIEANGDQAPLPAPPPAEEPVRRFFLSRLRRD
jgi:hypothetical protein